MHTVIRSHEICAGHRVVGHESKCRHLHGHNYVFHFRVSSLRPDEGFEIPEALDSVGRVVDFSVIKTTLCQWLEDNWDHKFLHWDQDTLVCALELGVRDFNNNRVLLENDNEDLKSSFVALPFNPTAENLAQYIVDVIGPQLLSEHGVELVSCVIEETSKCHVEYSK